MIRNGSGRAEMDSEKDSGLFENRIEELKNKDNFHLKNHLGEKDDLDSKDHSLEENPFLFGRRLESLFSFQFKNSQQSSLGIFERMFNRVERLVIILCHEIFDEVEAAMYLRIPEPETRGRETIRNYALRSKKISYHKIGRNGLTFLKSDLDKALGRFQMQSFRDL